MCKNPLYGLPLLLNVQSIIAAHKTGEELTISRIADKLLDDYITHDRAALTRRVRRCIATLVQSGMIKISEGKTPDHRLPYIIIITTT